MNIRKLKKLINTWLFIFCLVNLLNCEAQEYKIVEVINCIKIVDSTYSHSEDSEFTLDGIQYSMRQKILFNSDGKLERLIIYKTEGKLEYSDEDLLEDKALLDYIGFSLEKGPSLKGTKLINDDIIINVQKVTDNYFKSELGGKLTLYKVN